MKKYLFIMLLSLVCMANSECGSGNPYKSTYEVVEKSKDVGSHYNFFTDKQVVETEYIVVLKDLKKNDVFVHKCRTAEEYYQYEVGKRYVHDRYIEQQYH